MVGYSKTTFYQQSRIINIIYSLIGVKGNVSWSECLIFAQVIVKKNVKRKSFYFNPRYGNGSLFLLKLLAL